MKIMNEKNRIELYKTILNKYDNHLPSVMGDDLLNKLIDQGFFTAPASTKYHGAYE